MANITISSPNVTKNFQLDAAQVQRLLDHAAAYLDEGATNLEKEEWVVRRFFILMRDDLKAGEDARAANAAKAAVEKIPVTEV